MKIKLPNVEFYAWMWLVALILRTTYSVLFRAHFGDFPAAEIGWLILPQILLAGGFLVWRKRTEKRRSFTSQLWSDIWKVHKLNPIFWLHEIPRKTFVQTVLMGSLTHSLYLIVCSVSLMTSMALCSFRLYVPAEILYSKTPWPIEKGDRTFTGVWDRLSKADLDLKTDLRINQAIAQVYGKSSPQIADRLFQLGKQNGCCAVRNLKIGNITKANQQLVDCITNSGKAHAILEYTDYAKSSLCLDNICFSFEKLGHSSLAMNALNKTDLHPWRKFFISSAVPVPRSFVTTKNLIEDEPGQPVIGRSEFYNDYHLGPAETIAILFPIFFLAACYGCSGPLLKKTIVMFEIFWTRRLLNSAMNLDKRLNCMSKLSMLLLYQGKFKDAEICSLKMLRLAESLPPVGTR